MQNYHQNSKYKKNIVGIILQITGANITLFFFFKTLALTKIIVILGQQYHWKNDNSSLSSIDSWLHNSNLHKKKYIFIIFLFPIINKPKYLDLLNSKMMQTLRKPLKAWSTITTLINYSYLLRTFLELMASNLFILLKYLQAFQTLHQNRVLFFVKDLKYTLF